MSAVAVVLKQITMSGQHRRWHNDGHQYGEKAKHTKQGKNKMPHRVAYECSSAVMLVKECRWQFEWRNEWWEDEWHGIKWRMDGVKWLRSCREQRETSTTSYQRLCRPQPTCKSGSPRSVASDTSRRSVWDWGELNSEECPDVCSDWDWGDEER